MSDTYDTLMQTSLCMGFHWFCLFWWSSSVQGTGLLSTDAIYKCQLRVTHLIQVAGVFSTTMAFVYLHVRNSHIQTAMIAAFTAPNATRCQTFECVCEAFYPTTGLHDGWSSQWNILRLSNHLIIIIWGIIFLLLLFDIIYKRFMDSSVAGKLLHYRDAEGNKMKFHVFISHAQGSGGHQTRLLYSELTKRGIVVWYDQMKDRKVDVRAKGMVKGVAESAVFLLFLSGKKEGNTSPLRRKYCQLEIESARVKQKKLVVMYEKHDELLKFDWETGFDTSGVPGTKELIEEAGLEYPEGQRFDETIFQEFVNNLAGGHRAIMYDRDLGKIDGMMNDLIQQIMIAMEPKSNQDNSSL